MRMTSQVFTHQQIHKLNFHCYFIHTLNPILNHTRSNLPFISTHFNNYTLKTTIMAPRALLALRPITRLPTIRTFTTSPMQRIKEDANRTPEQVEAAKQDQLREQKEGKGRWREDLASHGESNIAADKQKVEDHGKHMEELQQEGKRKVEKGEL